MQSFQNDTEAMTHAIRIARFGFGFVEPNPMVGAVITTPDGRMIAEGFHERFGDAHAEINAIRNAGGHCRGYDLFVTLEPCCHVGKTPPCTEAVINAGFRRVIVGCQDPAPHVAGRGIQRLRDAGVTVETGCCGSQAEQLIAPFARLQLRQLPWVRAKWAMTLDGRVATRTGHSKWISSADSRRWVHDLRSRMDAVVTGAGTVRADDPLLTARPPGPRIPLRVIMDSDGQAVTETTRLYQTRHEFPVLVCVSAGCDSEQVRRLRDSGIQVLQTAEGLAVDPCGVLTELGRRGLTNVLLECGPRILGAFFDKDLIDQVHVFIAPKLIGGADAYPPVAGIGRDTIPMVPNLTEMNHQLIGNDVLIDAFVSRSAELPKPA